MVWLSELYGYHDSPVHGFIEVIGTVGRHDDQTIVPEDKTHIKSVIGLRSLPASKYFWTPPISTSKYNEHCPFPYQLKVINLYVYYNY